MNEFNWNAHPIVSQSPGATAAPKTFSWDDHPIVSEERGILPTIVDKVAQGASLGFADEASGALEAAGRVAGIQGLGGKIRDVQLAKDGPTLSAADLRKAYVEARDKDRAMLKQEQNDRPAVSTLAELGGSLFNPVAKLMPGAGSVKTGMTMGALAGLGGSDANNAAGLSRDTLLGAGLGAGAGYATDKISPFIARGLQKGSETLKSFAEKAAVNATGATGKQATTFADNAGRELLDRGIVRFGDDQATVASRAALAVAKANGQIDSALSKLEASGVKIDSEALKDRLTQKITEMKLDPSKADVTKLLANELENIEAARAAKGGADFGLKDAENIKRGYNRKAGNWADPEKGIAGKEMYQTFRSAVEDAAQKADPTTAATFEEGKKSYGLLAPIQEAAERRAATTSQSPAGGLADIAAAGAGMLKAGPVGAIAAPIARRLIAPRASSSIAVTTDKIADGLRKISGLAELEGANPAAFQSLLQHIEANYTGSSGSSFPRAADARNDVADNKRPTGQEKWTADGLANLVQHAGSERTTQKIDIDDPKTKELLIAASDAKPGTPAMDRIVIKIKNRIGKGKN